MKELIWVEPNSERWLSLEDLPNEEWRDIKDFEGLYQISNYGRVKSLDRFVSPTHHYMEKIIKMNTNKNGYYLFTICKNGNKKQQFVHQLVGKHFVNNPENKPIFNHLKNVTKNFCDNRYTNLIPVTYSENIQYAYDNGTKKANVNMLGIRGVLNKLSKKIIQIDKCGKIIRQWDCVNDIERELGFLHGNIISCCKGRYKQAYGYVWKYKEDMNELEI